MVVALVASTTLSAVAQSTPEPAPTPERDIAARAHFARGRAAYEQGNFTVALDAFQAAYAASQHPKLLYNVGLASQKLGHVAEAITAFESYLAWGEGDRAEEVRGRVAALRDMVERDALFEPDPVAAPPPAAVAAEAVRAEPAPMPAPAVPERSERLRRWLPWTIAGAVVAVVAVAIAVPLARKDDPSPAPAMPNTGIVIDALRSSR